jgi:transposase
VSSIIRSNLAGNRPVRWESWSALPSIVPEIRLIRAFFATKSEAKPTFSNGRVASKGEATWAGSVERWDVRRSRKPARAVPPIAKFVAVKRCRTDAFGVFLKERGMKTVTPGKSNRGRCILYDKEACKARNGIERCSCRIEEWSRIATRYDQIKSRVISSPALCFVAILAWRP